MIELTREVKQSYCRASIKRNLIVALSIWVLYVCVMWGFFFSGGTMPSWLASILFIPWLIVGLFIHNKWIVSKIWRYSVTLNSEQFAALYGKTHIPPPEKFKDIFKYQGENDIDWVLNQYNGFRIVNWIEKPPYIVHFFKEEDAIHFKLAIPSC